MSVQLDLFRLPPVGAPRCCTQHLLLSGRIVAYALYRDRRRLTLRIDERGLTVGAPRSVPRGEIEAFIRAHGAWVLAKLDELTAATARRHLPIHDGARLPVLGVPVAVRVGSGSGANRAFWNAEGLWLAARPGADLARLARQALQRRAREHFAPRVATLAARLGRPAPALSFGAARTRWGSCSLQTGIRLNWRLIHLVPELGEYVAAHEVAHLVEMNHGPRFWALVTELFPDWRAARAELKRQGAGVPLI